MSAGNHFLYVTASNKRNELIVYDFSNAQAGTPLRYQFTNEQWKEISRPGFLTRNVRLTKIEQEGDLNLDNLVKKNKLYLNKGKLQFIATPAYVMPKNLLKVAGRPDLSENGEDMFYMTLTAKYRF